MDAITALHTRNSVNLLSDPAPTKQQLENIFKAGLRACDHGNLRPWKFLLIEGEARERFGELMLRVKTAMDGGELEPAFAMKLKAKPLRAPIIIVVVAKVSKDHKIPDIEQILSAGASAQMMMVAAHAQGVGAIWRSGSLIFRPEMLAGLGLGEADKIVGLLYLGTPRASKSLPQLDPDDFVVNWQG